RGLTRHKLCPLGRITMDESVLFHPLKETNLIEGVNSTCSGSTNNTKSSKNFSSRPHTDSSSFTGALTKTSTKSPCTSSRYKLKSSSYSKECHCNTHNPLIKLNKLFKEIKEVFSVTITTKNADRYILKNQE